MQPQGADQGTCTETLLVWQRLHNAAMLTELTALKQVVREDNGGKSKVRPGDRVQLNTTVVIMRWIVERPLGVVVAGQRVNFRLVPEHVPRGYVHITACVSAACSMQPRRCRHMLIRKMLFCNIANNNRRESGPHQTKARQLSGTHHSRGG